MAAAIRLSQQHSCSFEPTSLVTNRRFCACEAGTNRHGVPVKPRSSAAHLIAVARRKQFMSSLPTAPWQLCRGSTPKLPLMIVFEIGRSLLVSKSEQFRFQQAVARTPHKPAQGRPKACSTSSSNPMNGRPLVPSPKRSESRERHRHWNWWIA